MSVSMLNASEFARRLNIAESELYERLAAHSVPRPDEYRDRLPFWSQPTVKEFVNPHPTDPLDLGTSEGRWALALRLLKSLIASSAAGGRNAVT